MATQDKNLMENLQPDDTGGCFPSNLVAEGATNWLHEVFGFLANAARSRLHGLIEIPSDYVGAAVIVVDHTANASTGDVDWEFEYRVLAAGDNMDQAPQEALGTDAASSAAIATAFDRQTTSITLTTPGNFVASRFLQFALVRNAATDTLSVSALLAKLKLQYSDT